MKKSIFWIIIILLIFVIFVLRPFKKPLEKGTDSSTSPTPALSNEVNPCGDRSAITIKLGVPTLAEKPAEFTTTGEEIFITPRTFHYAGTLFDSGPLFGAKDSTRIDMGPITTLPEFDSKSGTIKNRTESFTVSEGEFARVNLKAGRYWLWSSRKADIELVSCTPNGLSDPLPR